MGRKQIVESKVNLSELSTKLSLTFFFLIDADVYYI